MKKTVMYTETRAWFFELDLSDDADLDETMRALKDTNGFYLYMDEELNLKKMKHQPITVSSDKSIGDAGRADGYGFGQGDRIATCA